MDFFAGIPGLEGATSDQTPIGLPSDSDPGPPPGLTRTGPAVSSAPQISTAQDWWNTIKQDSSNAVDWVENEASTATAAVSHGVSNFAQGAVDTVTSPLKSTYWYLIIGVVVLGGVLYFIGRSGLVGQAAAVGRP